MIGGLITTGRFAVAGVLGADVFADAVGRYVVKLAFQSAQVDRSLGDEIVRQAQAKVPRDTGRLFNGITARQDEGGAVIVEASGVNPRDNFDYARALEFGHRTRRQADAGFFSGGDDGSALRGSRRSGSREVPAEPFFFPAAEEVLEKRGTSLEEMADQVGDEEGLT